MTVEDVDHRFFTALRAGDVAALAGLLSDDFVLIDVMRGAEVTRDELIAAVGGGQLRFDVIDVVSFRARRYGSVAMISGETRMRGRFGDTEWSAHSRYTHVYADQSQNWRLVSAQGTAIVGG
jgi:ketosteroid isomerase-like protein